MPEALEELLNRSLEPADPRLRLPESTYRLQFHAGFTFRDATAIVPYLADLGITHCYASPYLKARPGSTHGYDIVDHSVLNPEIGSPEDYEAFVAALRAHGLGHVLDVVPNHMGVGSDDNAWWNDVLENGRSSRYGAYFDIAWRASLRPELQDKVLLPVLGEPYGNVLEAGQLQLDFKGGAFRVHYYDARFPIAPRTYGKILGHELAELERVLGHEDSAFLEYQSILTATRNLPDRSENDPTKIAEQWREVEVIKRRLAALTAENWAVRGHVEKNVVRFNGVAGDPHSFDLLDELLEQQCYRLAYWRVAPDEINYRRFFDINELAALNMEREDVFVAAHRLVLRLAAEGKVHGLRIDHPDGLYDPGGYFRRLQEHYLLARARTIFDGAPEYRSRDWHEWEQPLRERVRASLDSADRPSRWPLYVVAEKILGAQEGLDQRWAIDGTSGYDFINMTNGLFVDPAHADTFTRRYRDWVEDDTRFPEMIYRKKVLILQISLSSELYMLTHQLDRLAQKSRRSRDFTFNTLRRALREVIACFPVYRSYISSDGPSDADRRNMMAAVRAAAGRNPLISRQLLSFVRDMLLLKYPESFTDDDRAEQCRFVGKFQQVTAPVTAKGVEDTAFYVYNRLASLNEVGGEPGRFGVPPDALHRYHADRQANWPRALSPLSTHDTKRSEDVRARLNVLSEIPDEWWQRVAHWSRLNAPHRRQLEDLLMPDANEEYLLYQTLVGAWPLEAYAADEYASFVKRIQAYMLKALHEAKVHTSWINPNTDYDNAIQEFIALILNEKENQAFLDDLRTFQRRISHYGLYNSLAQTLLKLTSPGVADTYQGTEIWDFSLVDPDNRRPVGYDQRRRLLDDLKADVAAAGQDRRELARQLVAAKEDGRVKLYVTYRALHCRRERPGLFSQGEYLALESTGPLADHVFAFARRDGQHLAIVVVPRLITRLIADPTTPPDKIAWQDTRLVLPADYSGVQWHNVFTGEMLSAVESDGRCSLCATDGLAYFPIALFVGHGERVVAVSD
jgi:(1->4)-alpha-D-glucan 1-alpha-D-glucosylmutase